MQNEECQLCGASVPGGQRLFVWHVNGGRLLVAGALCAKCVPRVLPSLGELDKWELSTQPPGAPHVAGVHVDLGTDGLVLPALTDAKTPVECDIFDARSDAHRTDPLRFELRCPVVGCAARCRVRVTRVSAIEASSVLAPPGWVLMFRQHFFGPRVGGLCPEHAKIWDDPVEEGSADD